MDRLAAAPETIEAIARHFRSDGLPPEAARHLSAELATHPDEIDTSIERYQDAFANFRSRGYSDEMAQHMAVESLESGESPRASRRYELLRG